MNYPLTSVFILLAIANTGFCQELTFEKLSSYSSGYFDTSGSEIVIYDTTAQYIYSTNGAEHTIDVLDASAVSDSLVLERKIDLSSYGGGINSVASYGDLVVAAVEADNKTGRGAVVFFNRDGVYINQVKVGALPDMVVFTSDGSKLLVACEGEPNEDYSVDPDGVVAVVDLTPGIFSIADTDVSLIPIFADSAGLD